MAGTKKSYFIQNTSVGVTVLVLEKDCVADTERSYKYFVTKDKKCSCKGFQHRSICKHLNFLNGLDYKSIPLAEAMLAVNKIYKVMSEYFEEVKLIEEPYHRDEKGLVDKITLKFVKSKKESLIPKGKWLTMLLGEFCKIELNVV